VPESARGLRLERLRNEIHDVAALLRRAIGCTARGFLDRSAGRIWPNLREQRCWVHKTANILDKMPKSVQGKAKQLIHEKCTWRRLAKQLWPTISSSPVTKSKFQKPANASSWRGARRPSRRRPSLPGSLILIRLQMNRDPKVSGFLRNCLRTIKV
jgi:hypothetical protein